MISSTRLPARTLRQLTSSLTSSTTVGLVRRPVAADPEVTWGRARLQSPPSLRTAPSRLTRKTSSRSVKGEGLVAANKLCPEEMTSLPVYYMHDILFSKKLLAKNEWSGQGFLKDGCSTRLSTKPLYVKAWAEICKSEKRRSMGVRNPEAVYKALLCQFVMEDCV